MLRLLLVLMVSLLPPLLQSPLWWCLIPIDDILPKVQYAAVRTVSRFIIVAIKTDIQRTCCHGGAISGAPPIGPIRATYMIVEVGGLVPSNDNY